VGLTSNYTIQTTPCSFSLEVAQKYKINSIYQKFNPFLKRLFKKKGDPFISHLKYNKKQGALS